MARARDFFAVLALCGSVIGCGGVTTSEPVVGRSPVSDDPSQRSSPDGLDPQFVASQAVESVAPPAIGQFKGRDHIIVIHAGSDGPRFTVTTLEGAIIARALSTAEMRAQHPAIYELYKTTFALQSGYLDASISPASVR